MSCKTPGQPQGLKTPKPETPQKKTAKYLPRALTPNSLKETPKNKLKIPQKIRLSNSGLLVFLSFFEEFGVGARGGYFWAAANGGVTNGGLRGAWPLFLEIGRNRPFSPFFCLFRPFPEGVKSTWQIPKKTEEKGLFPQISSDLLNPPSLKPPFAALRYFFVFVRSFGVWGLQGGF